MRDACKRVCRAAVKVAACAVMSIATAAVAQSNPGLMAPRINPGQSSLPNSVVLRGESQAATMQRLRVVRQYDLPTLRSNSSITLGASKVDLTPMLRNPRALFNVAQRLRTLPQHVQLQDDETQVSEVEQGLVIHHLLTYTILPGKCSDAEVRQQLESAGAACFQSAPLSVRLQAFSQPGSPRYVADPARRQRAIAAYQATSVKQEAEISGHIADLRKQFADPTQRAAIAAQVGAPEVDRLSHLTDDQLKTELINSAEQQVEQTLFVPKQENVARASEIIAMGITPTSQDLARQRQGVAVDTGMAQRLTQVDAAAQRIAAQADQVTQKDEGSYIYLTGFTLGRDYEWKQGISFKIKWCIIDCTSHYNADLYADFNYGFGLRFPIQTHLAYKYTVHPDGTDAAAVAVSFVPINGSPDDYAHAGLDAPQIFSGKELVAQVGADAGLNYDLPVLGSGNIGISVGEDFTTGLPSPFTNGQFQPPAPGTTNLNGAPIIFDQFDLLGDEANFGVAGGHIFPAIELGLHSDKLQFTLTDHVNGQTTTLSNSGQSVPIGVGKDIYRTSHITLANPVYNVGFIVTPGIDARLFIDLSVWSHNWDFPVWFPALTLELPPNGVDFGCHAGTICSRDFQMPGRTLSSTGVKVLPNATVPRR